MQYVSKNLQQANNTLVLGGNGKTGRRVAQQLITPGMPVRIGSRTGAWREERVNHG